MVYSPPDSYAHGISEERILDVVQSLNWIWLFATPWTAADQASLSFTNSQSLLKLISIELMMLSNHLILCCPLLLLPSIFPSIRVFSSEWTLHITWPKYWSFSFSISLFNEYSGLISFRIDWFDFLVVQGTLMSLLQHHGSKASILHFSAFLLVQFSYLYMTIGKTTALTVWTLVGKVMSLPFNTLSRFVIAFLASTKGLWISWLQSPSAVILEPKKIKSVTVSIFKNTGCCCCWVAAVMLDSVQPHRRQPTRPPSLGFSREEHWSGLQFPSSGDHLNPGIEPTSPTLKADSLQLSHQGSPPLLWSPPNPVWKTEEGVQVGAGQ